MQKALALLLLSSAVASPLVGQGDDEETRQSLAGLNGVLVLVEGLKEGIERAGLSRTQLQTDVELRLRQGGVPVLTQAQMLASSGHPRLYVNVNVLEVSRDFYAFKARLELDQDVALLRAPSITQIGAPTWSATEILGTTSRDHLGDRVRQNVRDMTDAFINAYLAANPKR